MRNIKSFLVSGIALCVLYLIVHSTFFSTSIVDDTQALGQKIYSPFTLSSNMDTQNSQVEEDEDEVQPAQDSQESPPEEAQPAEQEAQEPEPEASASVEQPSSTPAPAVSPAVVEPAPIAAPAVPPAVAQPAPIAAPAQPAVVNGQNFQGAMPAPTQAPVASVSPGQGQVAGVQVPAVPTDPAQAALPAWGQVPVAPIEQAPPPLPVEEPKEEFVGFDTIDLAEPSGNWLLKRDIWGKAQNKYEKIKGVFDQVLEARMPFFKRRAEIDRQTLDPLYISAGLDQEQIASILEEFNTLLSIDKDKQETLDERAKKMQAAAMEDKKTLEQLQKKVADLDTYSKALDSFLDKLSEQVNLGRAAEKQAWQAYKDIGKELNDKKARELWLGMETPFKRITDIESYIKGIFKQEFDKVCSTIEDNVQEIKNALQSLKEKGLDLKKFSKELDEKLQQQGAPKCEMPQQEEQEGWFGSLSSWLNSFQESIAGIYESIMTYFTGESQEEVVETKKKKDKPQDEKSVTEPTSGQPVAAE